MSDDAAVLTVQKGTPLHADLLTQMMVSKALSEMAGPVAMCKHTMAALIELMTDEPPEGCSEHDGIKGVPVALNGMDLAGFIVWIDGEPVFQPSVVAMDPFLDSLSQMMAKKRLEET